ncbi:MAG TPA: FecR domain-containing protein [Chthoniobacterales bacterium]
MKPTFLAAILSLTTAVALHAGALTEARISKIVNDVSVIRPDAGPHAASLNEVVKDELAVKTGIKSRSELLFQDDTLTRLGPESLFSFKAGTRDITLGRGTMLLQVPKGIGGAQIRTAAVTASITGTTIMIEHVPGKLLKVLVLEGSLRLSVNGRFGDSLLLLPGKMVIMPPNAKRIPDPVSIDLKKVVKTSSLVKMGGKAKPLPSTNLIAAEIASQEKNMSRSELVPTNLAIVGEGAKVQVLSSEVFAALDQGHLAAPSPTPAPEPSPTPVVPDPTPAPTPTATATPEPTATPSATPTPTPAVIDDAVAVNYGTSDQPLTKDFEIEDSVDYSQGGKHANVSVTSNGSIEIEPTVKVSSSDSVAGSKAGGNITLTSHKTKSDAILIDDSAQLLSLLNAAAPGPGGVIRFVSSGGKISVGQATIVADRGTIDIQNQGANGTVQLQKSTLSADTIKVQTLGANGQLNIGGGKMNADTAISLYAAGSNGTVAFTDNTTLSGNSVKQIAGDTVTVNNGKVVTVNGPAPANVYSNHPNYTGSGGNGSTTGKFAGQGATTQPLNALPGGH